MLQFRGGPALSAFRIRILLEKLQKRVPGIERLESQFLYFVDAEGTPGGTERTLLERLLNDGIVYQAPAGGALILVVPRFGTLSPWASKATDIAHNCGLKKLRRIERGCAYYLYGREGGLSREALVSVAAELHDRMTQSVLFDAADAAHLFDHA
ncbi:MAG TPA: phosphoribosylformylglycinamidine synthase, partial [Gammaproteobacteria bacterium]